MSIMTQLEFALDFTHAEVEIAHYILNHGEDVLNFIISGSYKGIGFDVIGLDPIADSNLTRHKALFKECEIVNIENLKNLELCGSDLFWFSCFPLKIDNCDGSPIRAVAWFE